MMITFPKAKINLGLRITAKRPDGYHDIETLFYPVDLSDALEFVINGEKHPGDELIVTGLKIASRPENNIVIKALLLIRKDYSFPSLKIHLHKVIPSGAGLGGGSSDASSLIKSVNRYFSLGMNDQEMRDLALELGSDCPFFIEPVPSFATGRGDILHPVNPVLEGYSIAILDPGVSISTKEAYLNCHPATPETPLENIIGLSADIWKKLLKNDFEEYAFNLYPIIGDIKKTLYKSGAIYSSMSGSGSSVFGIYEGKPKIPIKFQKYVIYNGEL
jgi:4-diphosphocytidyl-2-C-methyl-D-erythritol kinase